ncbi:lysine transporter LysE [Bacillus cereus]|nr:lysine transporter LysE [Bacillus cereus]MBT0790449.1 lysine transporter LysE [Bacillus cereus]MBX9157184.1 lysine transporter LysE [Bacillus cereus]TFZ09531.1 lysine transporter LysE [Bacillus cereus]
MVSLSTLLAFALVSLSMVCSPGPILIYFISRSITQGRMAGFIFLLSIMLGFVIHINEATLVFIQKFIVYETTRFVNGFNRKMSIVFFAARLNSFFVTLQ